MTSQELGPRLRALSEVHKEASQLIGDLSRFATPTTTSSLDEGPTRSELSSSIHQSLKEQEEDLEILKQEVDDLVSSGSGGSGVRRRDGEKDRDRVTFLTQVERLGEDLRSARVQFRKAQLQAKRNVEAAKRKEREALFADVQEGTLSVGGPGRRKGQEKLSHDDLLVNASSDVTAALRRMHQLMQSELSRSQFAQDTLQQSTAALESLNESYGALDTLLSSSRSLISTLVSSQKSDTWYLETTFWILVVTVGWLIFRRIFWIPYKAILLMLRVSIRAFISLTSAIGGSAALSSKPNQASVPTITNPTAEGGFPRFSGAMSAPNIRVGAGGGGAKAAPPGQKAQGDGTLSDKIGQMVDDARQALPEQGQAASQPEQEEQETVLRERRPDEPPNPKKRMFEGSPAEREQEERVRDEL